jgi:hypothetical protein
MTEKSNQELEINENAMTIFEAVPDEQRREAIKALLTGETPKKYILKRPARGGGEADYVNTYYMTRQISLVTGFRWKSECLKEMYRPSEADPIEIGAFMKVTILDSNDNETSHTSWGGQAVNRYSKDDPKGNYKKGDIISLFDDLKGAYSDGIKKCLSYFGIANDVYGSKDYELLEEIANDPRRKLNLYIENKGLSYGDDVFPTLKVKGFGDITDYDKALEDLKAVFG